MTKNDIEPTEVLAEPPLPTPPAAQPADTEQQSDQVVPQEAAPVAPHESAPVAPQEAAPVVPQQADQVAPQQAEQVVTQQAELAMPHNPYAQSHVVPLQNDQVVPPVVAQEAAPVVPQQADQAMPHNPYGQSHVGTSPSQEKEKQVITFDLSDGRLPPPKVFPTAQEMYAELWETGKRLVNEGLTQKGSDPGAAIVATGGQLMGRAADGMQLFEIPGRSFIFGEGHLERKPGSGGAPS